MGDRVQRSVLLVLSVFSHPAANGGRVGERDALLIMLAYRHGLRASELIALRWDQVDLKAGLLHVARLKHGSPSTHPLRGPELRALRAWKRKQGDATTYVFTSLRGGPMTRRTAHHVLAAAAKAAGIDFPVHPHMLRQRPAFTWPTPARTPAPSSCIWVTRTSSTRSVTPNWRQAVSKSSGRTNHLSVDDRPTGSRRWPPAGQSPLTNRRAGNTPFRR